MQLVALSARTTEEAKHGAFNMRDGRYRVTFATMEALEHPEENEFFTICGNGAVPLRTSSGGDLASVADTPEEQLCVVCNSSKVAAGFMHKSTCDALSHPPPVSICEWCQSFPQLPPLI